MIAALVLLACSRPEPEGAPEPRPWPGWDVRPALEHPMFAEHDLPELSLYATRVQGPIEGRPDFHLRGPFGVGNGAAFAMVGLDDPVNAFHGIAGPSYGIGARFFKDQAFWLEVDGVATDFETEWVARPRGTGLVITRGDVGELSLYTLDFAPVPAGVGPFEVPPVLVRRFGVVNRGEAPHAVRILGGVTTALQSVGGRFVDDTGDRALGYLSPGWDAAVGAPTADLGTVAGGGEERIDLVLGTADSVAELDGLAAQVAGADLDAWLDDTLAWWAARSSEGLQLSASDPRWADLYDANRVAIEVQTTPGGGVSPMSRYTLVWLRDTHGVARFLARAGLVDDAIRSVEYLYACHVVRGDYGNSCSSEIDPESVGTPPDWSSLPLLSGRTGAEGPGYAPLAADFVARWSGDPSVVDDHWDWLARGVLAQTIGADGKQGWSGDETFRAVMGIALGYPVEYDYPGLSWSSNSSLVLDAASARMGDWARELGRDPAPFDAQRALARQALEAFRQPDGHYASVEWHTAGLGNPVGIDPRPFEDVNLKELWLGVADPEDPLVRANLQAVREAADRGDGTWVSPMDPMHVGALNLPVEEGALTGMNPGYALAALTAVDAGDADRAFDALHGWARTSGTFPEDAILDDRGALHVLYDRNGVLSDISARYRPWEGAINAEALLSYLIGAEPADGEVRLHPHLPDGQAWFEARGMVVGGAVLDLRVERESVEVTARTAAVVRLRTCVQEFAPIALEAGQTHRWDQGPWSPYTQR